MSVNIDSTWSLKYFRNKEYCRKSVRTFDDSTHTFCSDRISSKYSTTNQFSYDKRILLKFKKVFEIFVHHWVRQSIKEVQ